MPLAEETNNVSIEGIAPEHIKMTRTVLLAMIENLARDELLQDKATPARRKAAAATEGESATGKAERDEEPRKKAARGKMQPRENPGCPSRRLKGQRLLWLGFRSSVTPVLACSASRVTPGASSTSFRPSGVTSITARSVMMRSTTPTPVSGSVHLGRIFMSSVPSFFLATCSISTITRLTPATRSIAPPMPLTILPGIIQLARSPFSLTCIAPRMDRLILPPRIIAKLSSAAEDRRARAWWSRSACRR